MDTNSKASAHSSSFLNSTRAHSSLSPKRINPPSRPVPSRQIWTWNWMNQSSRLCKQIPPPVALRTALTRLVAPAVAAAHHTPAHQTIPRETTPLDVKRRSTLTTTTRQRVQAARPGGSPARTLQHPLSRFGRRAREGESSRGAEHKSVFDRWWTASAQRTRWARGYERHWCDDRTHSHAQ
jgi:hypothetical protein